MLQAPMQEPLRSVDAVSLVSNLPVLGILGRQHQVDGVYHDLFTDLVYIFTDMKFYTFEATEFKVSRLRHFVFVTQLIYDRQISMSELQIITNTNKITLYLFLIYQFGPFPANRTVLLSLAQRVCRQCNASMFTF